jgi:hypothetical protein
MHPVTLVRRVRLSAVSEPSLQPPHCPKVGAQIESERGDVECNADSTFSARIDLEA